MEVEVSRQGRRTVFMALPRRTCHANRLPESHHGMLSLHMGVVKAPVCNLYRQPAAWSLSLRGQPLKLRQHLYYVYASLSRLDFRDLPEKFIVVFEGVIGFPAAKKPTALMMHWWNGGRGGV
jgi:hypothetical protein